MGSKSTNGRSLELIRNGLLTVAISCALVAGSVGVACADNTSLPFGSTSDGSASETYEETVATDTGTTTVTYELLTTYGVRAGSAGGDFVGVTNTNFDFTSGKASSTTQYTDFTSATTKQLAGLTIWGSSVNEYANPYYANLLYHAVMGTDASGDEATTWMKNEEDSSWGDSFGASVTRSDGTSTINGLEYSPNIIFGANKYTSWNLESDGSNSGTYMYTWLSANKETATFVSNDATNLWTQIYTMGRLATAADSLVGTAGSETTVTTTTNEDDGTVSTDTSTGNTSLVTRYDSIQSALNYEIATKGQMLYIASQIETNAIAERTVAYLYAIDSDGTAYFFVPEESGLLAGDDTGASGNNSATNPDDNYAANNSTINMGYMATLPFITNTFDSGNAFVTTTVYDDDAGEYVDLTSDGYKTISGIIMKVEDIYKANPACTVSSTDTSALEGVDVIIYNSTKNTDLEGTSGGKNLSGVDNDYEGTALDDEKVAEWAAAHGFDTETGLIIAGDDYGTSTNQSDSDTAPVLYCQRNYTADKNVRAAWAFSQVYPELYTLTTTDDEGTTTTTYSDATYCYWVDTVYHVNTTNVATVAAYMTGQSTSDVSYSAEVAAMVEANAEIGYEWYNSLGDRSVYKTTYAYYTGSSRASYYADSTTDTSAVETGGTIGIFAPSALWTASHSSSTNG